MDITLDTAIDFSSSTFKQFLSDKTQPIFRFYDTEVRTIGGKELVVALAPDGYEHDPDLDIRSSDGSHSDSYNFLVEEVWRVYQKNGVVGRQRIVINSEASIEIRAPFGLFLKSGDGLTQEGRDHARMLLQDYDADPAVHGPNIAAYLEKHRDPLLLTDEDYIVQPLIEAEVSDQFDPNRGFKDRLIDVDSRQRDWLFSVYGNDGPNPDFISTVDIIEGGSLDLPAPPLWQVVHEQQLRIGKEPVIRRVIEADGTPPAVDLFEAEVPAGTLEDTPQGRNAADQFLDKVLSDLVPSECGEMRRKNLRIMSALTWPEFRILWKRVVIKIGCAKISIKVPLPQTRLSNKVVFVRFSIPKNVGVTLFKVAETCAIRSAIAATVVGIVLANPGAAATSFNSLFKACIQRELQECIAPSLYVLKEAGEWRPKY